MEAERSLGPAGRELRNGPIGFVLVWLLLAVKPVRGFDVLADKPAPRWGFYAVLIRFVPTALIVLALSLEGRLPFHQPYLTFIPANRYFQLEAIFLPVFGIGIWLLMSAVAHTARRLTGGTSSFDLTLNVIGMGLLTPMLVLWTWDVLMIALGTYTIVVMAVSHTLAQGWEAVVEAIGLRRLAGYSWAAAVTTTIAINVMFIGLASVFVR